VSAFARGITYPGEPAANRSSNQLPQSALEVVAVAPDVAQLGEETHGASMAGGGSNHRGAASLLRRWLPTAHAGVVGSRVPR